MAAKKKVEKEVTVLEIDRGSVTFCVLGRTPLICNRVSDKAMRELLYPRKKTKADREAHLKHDPLSEFRASPYTSRDPDSPTLITFPQLAFKSALRNAALDMPGGAAKAQIGRLTSVDAGYTPIYGVPQMFMAVTRNSDINKTPDIRTRVIIPAWACQVTIRFIMPILNKKTIGILMAGAGYTQGVGDFRTEKGKGDFGQFDIVKSDDKRFRHILKTGGRAAQIEAMENPVYYDEETENLITWFNEELERRGRDNGKKKEAS